ncbi:MAG TPA: UDP-N-acetylmuramate dehydrogenase [Candidatus Cloacimonadota bacterium]|nr:UDP-N-acetylmuramate dehydrogenase [Candidatus Cloacimonadota bacterium]HPI25420.1 UDP-N-acetylmuramate dehydrogenase [Candidatus Cloacimonadota bacterium]
MIKNIMRKEFGELIDKGELVFDELMAGHTSFKIGGPAEAFACPSSIRDLAWLLRFCLEHEVPYMMLGKGSNLLVSDEGIRAVVISMERFTSITRDENYVSAFAGVSLRELCEYAQKEGLAGLEFACGIPGSVGGAVFMNAGAYGGEIKDVLYCSKCLIPEAGKLQGDYPVKHLKAAEHGFGYRSSALQKQGMIAISSVFKLIADDPQSILERMQDLDRQRWDKQPMDLPSAGSVFKRPEGHYTGKLVDDCGLRGYRIGDAMVSDKHCGFIVNVGAATAKEVMQVIRHVQDTVFLRYGVQLETEIRMIGKL